MKRLIDKDKAIAKIKKRFDEYSSSILKHYDACTEARASELGKVLVILNTLEGIEVDLEKELVDYHNYNFNPCGDGTLISCETGAELAWCDYERIAKHFFELGLKAQKGEQYDRQANN